MKYRLLLVILAIGVAGQLFCRSLFAGEENVSAIDTSTAAIMATGSEDLSQWSSSFDGIEDTAATLLETNNGLSEEYKALNNEIAGLNAEILKQEQTNAGYEESVRNKAGTKDVSANAGEVKSRIAKTEKEIAQAKKTLADLKAQQERANNLIALRRLKLKQLELEKRAALLDHNDSGNAVSGSLEAEITNLKEQVENQKKQERDLQVRLDALKKKEDPDAARAGQLEAENRAMKASLERLAREEADLDVLARGEIPEGADPQTRANFQEYQELQANKKGIKENIAQLTARKGQLDSRFLGAGVTEKDLDQKIKAAQEKNREFETQIENLRENIAVLDYKINTLERYRDRNKVN